jgi:hypothetical protein
VTTAIVNGFIAFGPIPVEPWGGVLPPDPVLVFVLALGSRPWVDLSPARSGSVGKRGDLELLHQIEIFSN